MDLPRHITIREHSHRILDPFTSAKLATLGAALGIKPNWTMLDLACGKGEMLCTWARDHSISGTGVDISSVFIGAAQQRADQLAVSGHANFIQADAKSHVSPDKVDIAACIGASWIGGGLAGTIALLEQSLKPGGLLLIGEPYWRIDPPDEETVRGCHAAAKSDFVSLPELGEQFRDLGWDLVEMVLADQDSWDRYAAAQWLNVRRWLDANPDDELWPKMRAELDQSPHQHLRYQREYLGWGVFALMKRPEK